MKKTACLLALFLNFYAGILAASTPSTEDVEGLEMLLFQPIPEVTTTGFFSTQIEKAPGFVQTFSMEDINSASARTLSDLIDSQVLGMVSGRHEGNGALIGSRGVLIDNNAKTLLMLDGQQLNARAHGWGDLWDNPFLGDIKTVEVVNGPGAIVHGSGAINGFVNLIPRNGTDDKGLNISSEYGEFENLKKLEAGYGLSYGENRDFYVYGGVLEAQGGEPHDPWNGSIYKDTAPEDSNAYGFSKSNYKISAFLRHEDFSLNTFFMKLNPSSNTQWANRPDFRHNLLALRPKYILNFNEKNALDIIASGEWQDVGNQEAGGSGSKESHQEMKFIYRNTAYDHHQIALGGLYGIRNFKGSEQYFSDDYPNWYPMPESEWKETGLFGEDVITVDQWTFSLGLRWDNQIDSEHVISNEGTRYDAPEKGHVSPRFAASYEMDDKTILKTSYQQGFRYPDANYYMYTKLANDRIAAGGGSGQLSALKPETMDSLEASLRREIPDYKASFDFNLFYNKYEDQLSWDGLTTYLSETDRNILIESQGWAGAMVNLRNSFKTYGGELIFNYTPWERICLRTGYGYSKTQDLDTVRYPCHQFKTEIRTYFLENKLLLTFDHTWNSKLADSATRHPVYGHSRSVFNMSANYAINDTFSLEGIVKNLFKDDTPTTGFSINNPTDGHLGENERRLYMILRAKA